MKTMLAALLMLGALNSFADSSKTINFSGQEGDSLILETIETVTRYREEDRDTTCTRQVPYQTEECGYETRYRQECRWEPGRNVCRTEYENRCRTLTRYRRECTRGEPRRVCRQTEPRRICRNGVCRTEPGRRVCDYRPGRNVCSQVPYQEWVCRTVTRYRDETYPCRRTVRIPYNFNRKVKAEVNLTYNDPTQQGIVDFLLTLNDSGKVSVKANDKSPRSVLIGMDKVTQSDVSDDETLSQVNVDFTIYDKEKELAPIKKNLRSGGLSNSAAWFTMGQITNPDRVNIRLVITRKTILGNVRTPFDKVLSANEVSLQDINGDTKVLVDLSKYGVKLKDKDWTLKVDVELNFEDSIINRSRETLKRSGQFQIDLD